MWEWDWEPWEDTPKNCPKCGKGGLYWVATEYGRKWLKDDTGQWHQCKEKLSNLPDLPEEFI